MKNKISNLLFVISLFAFIFSLCFSINNKSKIDSSYSEYYPTNTLKFSQNFIKTKKDEKVVIKVQGGEKDKVKYVVSDASKIRIVSSSHQGIIIERISDYLEEAYICVFNKEYEELSDICYITCYNEILSCEDINLYKTGLNDNNADTYISLTNGTYYLEFLTSRINNNFKLEDESKSELKANIEEFFNTEIVEKEAKKLEICFEVNVDVKKVFAYEIRKTMSFKIDRAIFIYTFQKGL